MGHRSSPRRLALLLGIFGLIPVLGLTVSLPASAQELEQGTCPSSVDTVDEGWICSLLLLDTPTDSPSSSQITLWTDELVRGGRQTVTEGIVFSDVAVDAKIRALYQSKLGREPDPDGLAYWRERVQTLGTELVVEFGVFNSGEYLSQFESVEPFVNDQYQYYLGREASREEQAYWAGLFVDGAVSNEGITWSVGTSAEAGAVRARILYQDYARRAPDAGGLAYWGGIASERGLFGPASEFATSPEVVATLGRIGLDRAGNSGGGDGGGALPALSRSCSSSEGFAIRYPSTWAAVAGCGQFGPAPLAEPAPGTDERPGVVGVRVEDVAFNQVSDPMAGEQGRAATAIQGLQAVRVESVATGDGLYPQGTRMVTWMVDLAIGVDDGPGTLIVDAVGTSAAAGADFNRAVAIMDLMARTLVLDVGDEPEVDQVVARYEGGGAPVTVAAAGAVANPSTCLRLLDVDGAIACVEAVGASADVALAGLDAPGGPLTVGIASPDVFSVEMSAGSETLTFLPVAYPGRDSLALAVPLAMGEIDTVTLRSIDGTVLAQLDGREAERPAG